MTLVKKPYLHECRLDSWLWAARFYKTRTLAALNIKKGFVRLSGKTTTKPSSLLSIGSKLVIEQGLQSTTVLVTELALKRVSFEKAQSFYQIISKESKEPELFFQGRERYKPDKRARRNLKAFKEKLHFLSDN